MNTVSFKKAQSSSEAKVIANHEISVVVQGGGVFGAVATVAGGLAGSYMNQSANSQADMNQDCSYKSSLEIQSTPQTDNMKEWRKMVMNQKKGWTIIGKQVERVCILKLLIKKRNLKAGHEASEE